MLRRVSILLWELLLVTAAFFAGGELRHAASESIFTTPPSPEAFLPFWPLTLAIAAVLLLCLPMSFRRPSALIETAKVLVIGLFLIGGLHFGSLLMGTPVNRGHAAIFGLLVVPALAASRVLGARWIRLTMPKDQRKHILVVGDGSDAIGHAAGLPAAEYRVVGFVADVVPEQTLAPLLGRVDALESVLSSHRIEEVHFATSVATLPSMLTAIRTCRRLKVRTRIPVTFLDGQANFVHLARTGLRRALALDPSVEHDVSQALKRGMDILASAFGLLMLAPFMMLIATIVRLTSPGPVLYRSRRIGRGRVPFSMYKFRTMIVDADRRRLEVPYGPFIKIAPDDPRITSFGRFLRRTSLDEIPQLVNILRGEMSLVGPRPLMPEEAERIPADHQRRFMARPGLTGFWQTDGRSDIDAERRLQLDVDYVDRWNLAQDLRVLFRTVPTVLSRRGAR